MKPINNTKIKPRRVAILEILFTICIWTLIAYLAFMLLTVFTWGGIDYLFKFSILGESVSVDTFQLFASLLLFGLAVYLLMVTWAAYNYRRYGCNERRKTAPKLAIQEFSRATVLTMRQVVKIRDWQVMRAGFDGLLYHYDELPVIFPEKAGPEQTASPEPGCSAESALGLLYRENTGGKEPYLPIGRILKANRSAVLCAGLTSYRGGNTIFLFGEPLREILLGRGNPVTDVLCASDATELAQLMQRAYGGKLIRACPNQPAELLLADGPSRCRFFNYQVGETHPENNLKHRLYCEDFTINSLACSLAPDNFGRIWDFFGGTEDLHSGIVRSLYRLSFVDNPARIFRAIAIAASLGFTLEPETEWHLEKAIAEKVYRRLSQKSLSEEALRIFQLPAPPAAIEALHRRGLFGVLFPRVPYSTELTLHLERVSQLLREHDSLPRTRIYYSALLYRLPLAESLILCSRLVFSRQEASLIRLILRSAAELTRLLGSKAFKPDELNSLFTGAPAEVSLFLQTLHLNHTAMHNPDGKAKFSSEILPAILRSAEIKV